MKALSLAAALTAAAFMLAACGSSTEIVSKGPDSIAVAADSPENIGSATEAATDYCKTVQKRAELQRTENAGKGVVAYYACK
jgi:hypothetical protein